MAPPVNRKAAERARLAIFGESAIRPVCGQGAIQLTAEAVKMHDFSSDSECSTPSSQSDTSSSSSQCEEDVADGITPLSANVDNVKNINYDEKATLPDLNCCTIYLTKELLAAAAAVRTTAKPTAGTAAFGKPKKKMLISL